MLRLALLNFVFLFARPQYSLPFLGTIRLPLILSILAALAWLLHARRSWTRQTKIIALFLAVEALRIFIGKTIADDLVRNDNWAYLTWSDLLLQCLGVILPLVAALDHQNAFDRLIRVWCLVGAYLGGYVILHAGRGPGGFTGDENDAGLVLLMFLALPLSLLIEGATRGRRRLFLILCTISILGGIFATFSRGAFVGLVALGAYFFLRSSRKLKLIIFATIACLASIPFVPEGYVQEMRTILQTNEGTANQRREFWTVATRVWLDPKHFLIGVGMRNVPFYLADYETLHEIGDGPSMGGRAVHSIYFQLLPELGLWGICIVGFLIFSSYRSNERNARRARQLSRSTPVAEQHSRAIFVRSLCIGFNGAFAGVLASGLFISALYYPPIWLIAALSSAINRFWNTAEPTVIYLDRVIESPDPDISRDDPPLFPIKP